MPKQHSGENREKERLVEEFEKEFKRDKDYHFSGTTVLAFAMEAFDAGVEFGKEQILKSKLNKVHVYQTDGSIITWKRANKE